MTVQCVNLARLKYIFQYSLSATFLARVCYREDSWENRRMKGKQHLLFSSCTYLLICWHFVFMKQEVDLKLLYFSCICFRFSDFWARSVCLLLWRRTLTSTRVWDKNWQGFSGVSGWVCGFGVALDPPTLHLSSFPAKRRERHQPSQRLIIQLPQLLMVNSLLKIPLSVCILLSSLSSYLNLGCVKLSVFYPQLWV